MDSTFIPAQELENGRQAITIILPIVMGILIPIVVGGLKKLKIVGRVEPTYLTGILAIIAAWVLSRWLAPDMSIGSAITLAGTLGYGATLLHRTKKIINRKQGHL